MFYFFLARTFIFCCCYFVPISSFFLFYVCLISHICFPTYFICSLYFFFVNIFLSILFWFASFSDVSDVFVCSFCISGSSFVLRITFLLSLFLYCFGLSFLWDVHYFLIERFLFSYFIFFLIDFVGSVFCFSPVIIFPIRTFSFVTCFPVRVRPFFCFLVFVILSITVFFF
jgi:hypothetical protein